MVLKVRAENTEAALVKVQDGQRALAFAMLSVVAANLALILVITQGGLGGVGVAAAGAGAGAGAVAAGAGVGVGAGAVAATSAGKVGLPILRDIRQFVAPGPAVAAAADGIRAGRRLPALAVAATVSAVALAARVVFAFFRSD